MNAEGVETTHGDILREVQFLSAHVQMLEAVMAITAIVAGCIALTATIAFVTSRGAK